MPDELDLAGVIGTWVAVFLALVALLGLLPAYIFYRKSRSAFSKALFKVDDPSQKFVSNRLLFGFLPRQNVKVPDLRNPPDPSIFENVKLQNKPTADILGPHKSTTGWVEFAQIIAAVFPRVKYGGSNLLDFTDERISLPVHNTWLLALGILHRYSRRTDYGLPIEAATEATSENVPQFSGLSGYLNIKEPQDIGRSRVTFGEPIEAPKLTRINFQMHGISSLQLSLKQDSLSFHTLATLFVGYINDGDGQLFNGTIHRQHRSRKHGDLGSLKVVEVAETEIAGGGLNIVPGIHVEAKKKIDLVLTEIEASDLRPWIPSDKNESVDGLREVIKQALPSLGLYKLATWDGDEIWMLRKDTYRFAFAYLKQQPSPHGFLYDSSSDIVVSQILSTGDITPILALAETWLSRAEIASEMHKQILQAIRIASRAIPTETSLNDYDGWRPRREWSRHVLQAISSLDDAFDMMASPRAVMPQHKRIVWMAIRTIYASNQDFRISLNGLLKELADQNRPVSTSVLRVEETAISLLGADGEEVTHSFDFDFRYVLTEAKLDQSSFTNKGVPIIDTVLASLQGQLRAVAWDMTLSPDSLGNFRRHASDISLVETYVPQFPGTEVWLKSAAHKSTSSQTVFRSQYAEIRAVLANMKHEYAKRRDNPDAYENPYHERTEIGSDPINAYPGPPGTTIGSSAYYSSSLGQPRLSRAPSTSPPSNTGSNEDVSLDSEDLGQNQAPTAKLAHSLTKAIMDLLEDFESSRTRPIARARSNASQTSAPF